MTGMEGQGGGIVFVCFLTVRQRKVPLNLLVVVVAVVVVVVEVFEMRLLWMDFVAELYCVVVIIVHGGRLQHCM